MVQRFRYSFEEACLRTCNEHFLLTAEGIPLSASGPGVCVFKNFPQVPRSLDRERDLMLSTRENHGGHWGMEFFL